MPAPRPTVGSILNKLIERVNANVRRLRILEQDASVLKARLTSAEQEITAQKNEAAQAMHDAMERVAGVEERFLALESSVKDLGAQLKRTVTSARIRELEQLIDMYNPIKSQFLTREEADRLIEARLGRKPPEE